MHMSNLQPDYQEYYINLTIALLIGILQLFKVIRMMNIHVDEQKKLLKLFLKLKFLSLTSLFCLSLVLTEELSSGGWHWSSEHASSCLSAASPDHDWNLDLQPLKIQ